MRFAAIIFAGFTLVFVENANGAINLAASESGFRLRGQGKASLQGLPGMINLQQGAQDSRYGDVSSVLNSETNMGNRNPLQVFQREFLLRNPTTFSFRATRDAFRDLSRNGPVSAVNRFTKDAFRAIRNDNIFIRANRFSRSFASAARRTPLVGGFASRVVDGPVDTVLDLGSNIVRNIATPFEKGSQIIEESQRLIRRKGPVEAGRNLVGKGIRLIGTDGVLKTTGKIIRDVAGSIGVNL